MFTSASTAIYGNKLMVVYEELDLSAPTKMIELAGCIGG